MILAANEIGRPIVATPGIPADRVKILREAFMKTVNDPELLDDAKKKKLELDPVSGEELETLGKRDYRATAGSRRTNEKIVGHVEH